VSDKSFDRYESLLSNILRSVNDSLPRHVVRYRDVVELGMEGVETVGGSFHRFDRNDLEKLAKQLPENILDRLHLPFVSQATSPAPCHRRRRGDTLFVRPPD
jgi:uncharacterized protein (UPF0216 family)